MRYLSTPVFSAKLAALTESDIKQVSNFLQSITVNDRTRLLENRSLQITPLRSNMYVSRLGHLRVYFTLGDDAGGEYSLLLDLTTEHGEASSNNLFAAKNPRTNSSLNPEFNSSINPRYNSGLNPKYNSSINPLYNSSINPRYNSSLNPQYNSSINPKYNSSINPKYNSGLNPRYNSSINPRFNTVFGGPYFYNLELQQVAYLVKANDEVDLLFDLSGIHLGELVRAANNVRIQFDIENVWDGFLVTANENVSLRFDNEGNWIGLVV